MIYCHHFNRKLTKLKFLSRCHLHCWITINSSWTSIWLFFLSPGHTNEFHPPTVGSFLSLIKNKTIKRNISCISKLRFPITTRTSSDQTLYGPGPRGNGFDFPGAARSEKNREYPTNSAQVSYKLAQKNNIIFYWNVSSQSLQNFDHPVYFVNEAVCSSAKKIANEGRT